MYNCRILCHRLLSVVSNKDFLSYFNSKLVENQRIISRYKMCSHIKQFSTSSRKTVSQIHTFSTFDELVNYVANARRIETKYISQVLNELENCTLTEEHVLFLLECCGKTIPGENFTSKHTLCQTVFKKFQAHLNYSEKVYQTYINVCNDNRQMLDIDTLIFSIKNNITFDIFKLLLRNVCERGDTEKAQKVLLEMKKRGYPADDHVFNDLILCHTIKGGITSGQNVVKAMHMAKLSDTYRTKFAIIKGLAQRTDVTEFNEALSEFPVLLNEEMLFDMMYSLAFSGNHNWIKYINKLFDKNSITRNFAVDLEDLCMNLIHNQKYDAAMTIYELFIDPKPHIKYAGSILREMLICSAPIEKIVEFAKVLKQSGLNEYALEDVTDLALKYKLTRSAMHLLKCFDILRPHYFWPILIRAHINGGEKGLMEVVENVANMNIKFDSESLQNYIFPYCDLSNPQRIIQKFQEFGYTVRTLLTPMVVTLLRKKETKLALKTCNSYDVQIGSQELIDILPYTWISTVDHDVCLSLLQKISESQNEDLLRKFLTEIISKLSNPARLRPVLQLLKDSKIRKLRIDTVTVDILIKILQKNFASYEILPEIEDAINDLLDFMQTTNVSYVLHPRNMNTEQLECHLVELKAKNMETRGITRKLIQKYTSEGNLQKVKELEHQLMLKKYNFSPGMKSSIMHTNINEENLPEALNVYYDLRKSSPNFKIDSFKIVDLASLLVKKNNFEKAVDILLNEAENNYDRKIQTSKSLERNCRVLLSSIKDLEHQKKMFDVLIDNGYCRPNNVILGCLIQLHLEKDDLKNTVDMFIDFSQKYRKTPMQLMLICEALGSKDQELLQKVLNATSVVHGNVATHSALISALCEKGYKKQLIALLQGTRLNPLKEMEKRCEWWTQLGKLEPLHTLLEVSREVSPKMLNKSKIQLSIMQVYSRDNDCEGAMEFWKTIVDHEDFISSELDMEFYNLLDRCRYQIPENLDFKYRVK